MKKTKIIELEFLGPPAIGGIEIYVEELCKRFDKKKFDVEIWSTDLLDFDGKRDKNIKNSFFNTKIKKFKAYFLPFPPKIICPGLIFQLLRFKNKNSILHTHSLAFHTFLGLLFHKKFSEVFVVLQYNTDDLISFLKTIKGKIVFAILRYFSKKKNVNFVAVTGREAKIYKEIGIDSIIIPNGVNVPEFDNIRKKDIITTKKKYGIENTYNILYAGRVHKNKGIDILLLAFKEFSNRKSRLIIAGADFGFSDYLKKLAKQLKIEDQIIITGYLPRDKYIVFFKCCDLFVLPSVKGESFGMVLAEAMACAKPVIGTNFDGIPDVIRGDSGLLFKKGSAKDLFKKIKYIYRKKGLAKIMGINGRKLAQKEYDWSNIVKIYEGEFK